MKHDELVHRRVHRADPDLLFECLTTPEHLAQFWGPDGATTPVEGIVVDLRPGGAFETRMTFPATGHEHLMRAVYEVVDRPTRLVWREVESGMRTTITFSDLGDGTTEVVTRQQFQPEPNRTPEARAGWARALDRFAAHVSRLGPADPVDR